MMEKATRCSFSEIQNKENLVEYLFDPTKSMKHVEYLTTYTKVEYFLQALSNKKWRIGSPMRMNDGREMAGFPKIEWEKMYYSCFIADSPESIAMWSVYGRPWSDAVSIQISRDVFLKWLRETEKVYQKNSSQEYCETEGWNIRAVRVAYTNEQTKEPTQKIKLTCGAETNEYINNIFGRQELDSETDKRVHLAGTIKDSAWAYENEVRLRVDFEVKLEDKREVYIDIPDYVMENMIVTAGPLFYGNLECRLGGYSREVLKLKYSEFTGLLNGMPCYSFNDRKDSLCQESVALFEVKKQIISAYQLVLHQYYGKGIFRFDTKGEIQIGSGEYLFNIGWKQLNNSLIIENAVAVLSEINVLPNADMLFIRRPFEHNVEITNSSIFVCKNSNNRVLTVKLSKEGSGKNIYYMEYKMIDNIKMNVYAAEDYRNKSEFEKMCSDTDGLICGTWWDKNSQR